MNPRRPAMAKTLRFPKATRYKPICNSDGAELVSAESVREMDMKQLMERLSPRLIDRLTAATQDELAVLEAFAEGLYTLRIRDAPLVVNDVVILEREDGFDRVARAVPRVFPRAKQRRGKP